MFRRILSGELPALRFIIVASVAGLVIVGLLAIDASGLHGQFARKQLLWVGVGVLAFLAVNQPHYRTIGRFSSAFFAVAVLGLILILAGKYLHLSAFVPPIRGATRWLRIVPHSPLPPIQPSELAKLAYILSLAAYLCHRKNFRTLSGLIPPLLLTLVPMALILLQPDLGTVLLFPPILFAVLFVAGARLRHLLTALALAVILLPIAYFTPGVMEPYQKDRIQVLVNQGSTDPYWLKGPGYQLYQSKLCIGSGRLTGPDQRVSPFLYRHLPDIHNDFIFALIAHRWGLVGSLAILALYTALFAAGSAIAAYQTDPLAKLLAVGICALLATQTCINIAMTIGLMPITGMTLPFVSYGGTSLLTNFLAVGLLFNLARRHPRQIAAHPFQFDD